MKYQFVVQFAGSSLAAYDAMIALEEALIRGLPESSEVDGHDMGAGELNIFINTNDPEQTFEQVRALLESAGTFEEARIAYREFTRNDYTPLWPKDLRSFRVA